MDVQGHCGRLAGKRMENARPESGHEINGLGGEGL
jgi:hypothetical protein